MKKCLTKDEAKREADHLVAQLGPGWDPVVWENGGFWYHKARCGRLSIHPSMSEGKWYPLLSSRDDGLSSGAAWWTRPGATYDSPKEAVTAQLDRAHEFLARVTRVIRETEIQIGASGMTICGCCGAVHPPTVRGDFCPACGQLLLDRLVDTPPTDRGTPRMVDLVAGSVMVTDPGTGRTTLMEGEDTLDIRIPVVVEVLGRAVGATIRREYTQSQLVGILERHPDLGDEDLLRRIVLEWVFDDIGE